jgi:excisionase family DNA binding protein
MRGARLAMLPASIKRENVASMASAVAFASFGGKYVAEKKSSKPRKTTMTMPSEAQPFGMRMPTMDERRAAHHLRRVVEEHEHIEIQTDSGPETIVLGRAMSETLSMLLGLLAEGNAVTLVPIEDELTSQQAADLLNVSRPFLIKLVDSGELECRMVGRHRRLRAEDVFRYKASMREGRDLALKEIADASEGMI